MTRHISIWCQKLLENWHNATIYDYAFLTAWVLVAGFLISKISSYSTK